MKKIFVSMSLLLTVAASSAFANHESRSDPGVEEVFKQEFIGAENVKWSKQENYHVATFVLAGHRAIAYYNENNEMAGCIRDVFYTELPLTVMKAIDKKFPSADKQEIREIINDEGTSYTLRVELKNKKFKIRVSSYGSITVLEKVKN